MRAVRCSTLEGPQALELVELPEPTPAPGEVAIAVACAALNHADLLITRGRYQEKPALPFTPGFELAGIVRAVGAGVTDLAPGTPVLAVVDHGAFAEVARARAADVVPITEAMPFDVAAAFPIAYGTAHGAFAWRAALQPDETVLVHGAAGGVGLTAVEVGKAMGARIIATARGAERLKVPAAHGADAVIDTAAEDLRERVMALTDGRGVDVCYDAVGGELGEQSLRCLAWQGRYLVIGLAAGVPEVKANHLLVKNTSVVGFYWGSYRKNAPARVATSLQTLLAWYAEGKLQPHVSGAFGLDLFKEALTTLETRRSTGKVVLTVSGDAAPT